MKSFLKIFLMIFVPVFTVLVAGFFYANFKYKISLGNKLNSEMDTLVNVIQTGFDLNNFDYESYKKLKVLYDKEKIRLTVIDKATGKVLMDNSVEFENIKTLDNHLTRPEVKEAMANGYGFYSRYSNTIKKDLIYYAKVLDNKIVRIAYPEVFLSNYGNSFKMLMIQVGGAILIIIVILAIYFARMVSVPVQKLNYIAEKIEEGKTKIHFPSFKDPTMSKVSSLIYKIYHLMLKKQEELVDSKERLNFIFSVMDEAILLMDKNNSLLYLNESAGKLFNIEKTGDNIFNVLTDLATISFFKKIVSLSESKEITEKFKNKTLQIYIKVLSEYNLFVIKDISKESDYETFKTELVGNISHELKTPVSMIMGYSETIINNKDLDKDTTDKFVKKIFDSSVRLNNLIEDILKLHKLEMLGLDFKVDEPVECNIFKSDIEDYYAGNAKRVMIDVRIEKVFVEYEHMLSVVTNLVDNAIKYSKGEEVYVEIEKINGYVNIRVADQGPVIPENEMTRIFERFYTTSKSRNKINAGTGLGLSIVKHIAAIYNGKIRVYKNSMFGNTFEVSLQEKS